MADPRVPMFVLKTVKKIVVQFCPFESNVQSTREFLALISSKKVRLTNMDCEVTCTVKHDKSEPVIDVTYVDGERLLMKGAHLTFKEMRHAFDSRCKEKDTQKDTQKKVAAAK